MKTNILGLSHINIVVDDIKIATSYYKKLLGVEVATDSSGNEMDYPNVQLRSFALNAGFMDGQVDVHVRFLKHLNSGIYIELMKYLHPKGTIETELKKTNDIGGVRHIAFEVQDINSAFDHISAMTETSFISVNPKYGPPLELTPFPIKFFYFIDKYGVQWEFEEGREMTTISGIK